MVCNVEGVREILERIIRVIGIKEKTREGGRERRERMFEIFTKIDAAEIRREGANGAIEFTS
jgi:hypothetical protein